MTRRLWLSALCGLRTAAAGACPIPAGFGRFDCERFDAWGFSKCVYRTGNAAAPSVLFLHEINGLGREALQLAERLRDGAGVNVYLPVFFGKPAKARFNAFACTGSQFDCRAWHSSGQIVHWVTSFVEELGRRHRRVAVIGNCLTGSLPLAVMADGKCRPFVKCAVVSQPALPVPPHTPHAREMLGLTDEQLEKAVHSGIPVLAYRFDTDLVVPIERMRMLEKRFEGKPFEFIPWPANPPHCDTPNVLGKGHQHAVLTSGYCGNDPDSSGYKAYERLESFLKQHLSEGHAS